MPKTNTSTSAKNSNAVTSGTLPYPYSHLTKAEIVSLFSGSEPATPLTPREFTRCAISIVSRWCDAVLSGRFSSAFSVHHQLETLARIYKNG